MFRSMIISFVIVYSFIMIYSCTNDFLDKSLQQSADIVNSFVKVHDVIQESVTGTQQFCVDMYIELSGHEKLQKRLVDFCNRADKVFFEIQRIEKQVLKD